MKISSFRRILFNLDDDEETGIRKCASTNQLNSTGSTAVSNSTDEQLRDLNILSLDSAFVSNVLSSSLASSNLNNEIQNSPQPLVFPNRSARPPPILSHHLNNHI